MRAVQGRGPDPRARAAAQLARDDATILGVTYLDNSSDSEEFVRQQHITYPVVRDVSGNFVRSFGTTGVPETFVINRQGRIVALRRYQLDGNWLQQTLPPAPGRALMTRTALARRAAASCSLTARASAPPARAAATTQPRASLTDIENDVMCVACHEPLAVAQSPQADSERAYIRRLIAQGLDQAADRAEPRRPVRRGGARQAAGAAAST